MGRMLVGIIGVFILMMLFPMMMTACHEIQTDDRTDSGLACTADPMDVVLTTALWNDDTGSVISAVDSEGNVLAATAYVSATKTLTVTGWVTPATTCTIVYETDALTSFTGFGAIVGISPMLLWMAFIGGFLYSIYSGVKGLKGGF